MVVWINIFRGLDIATNLWWNLHFPKDVAFKHSVMFAHERHTIWIQSTVAIGWNCMKGSDMCLNLA